jgi:predicted porin
LKTFYLTFGDILMKKTLIAAAVAASFAAPAMADVSVSGQVKVTIADSNGSSYNPSYDNALSFKASEDLGNGMSAFAEITLDTDSSTGGSSTATGSKDQKLGLKGSWGTLVAGRMETLTEGVVSAKFDDGASAHADNGQLESAITQVGRVDAVAYVSPTVNGFHVAVAGILAGAEDGLTAATDILVAYDNGPLSVVASRASFDAGVGAGLAGVGSDENMTSIAASYSMGDGKFTVGRFDQANETDMLYRLDYKMGNNSIILGMKDAEVSTNDLYTVKLTHSMSKRTAVWVGHRAKDTADDVTHFGMIHKF